MRFRRQVATNRLYAKVCPQCLRQHGVTKLSWQLRAAVGCAEHGYSLIWMCPQCGESVDLRARPMAFLLQVLVVAIESVTPQTVARKSVRKTSMAHPALNHRIAERSDVCAYL